MKEMIMNGKKTFGRALLLCLCAALLYSAAFAETAETVVDLGNTAGEDGIQGCTVLPTGQVVFGGYSYRADGSGESFARLLCLNPDRTVAWSYTEQDQSIDSYSTATVTGDNTIAALSSNGYRCIVKFFTPEGEPTGEKLSLEAEQFVYEICPYGVIRTWMTDKAEEGFTELIGWDGNVIFRTERPSPVWAGGRTAADGDGLVLDVLGEGGAVKLVKFSPQGETVWEAALPSFLPGMENTYTGCCVKTADGGYLVTLLEYGTSAETQYDTRMSTLVKLGSGGEVLWTKPLEDWSWLAAEYDGKYAVCAEQIPADGYFYAKYLWYGADGSELGTTEFRLREEDVPPYTDREHMAVSAESLVPMRDGLWQELCFWGTDEPEEEEPAWSSCDFILAPVPEL